MTVAHRFRLAAPLLAAGALAGPATAQEIRVFEMNPSTGFLVHWSATSNLGPLGAFLQSYSFHGDMVVDFDQSPALGTARITSARLRISNSVVGALMSGPSGVVFWRDVVLDATSPDFTVVPAFPAPVFATDLQLSVSSGFAEIDPPFGPAFQVPLAGTQLGAIPISGSFPTPGPSQALRIDPFQFDMDFAASGWNGTFTHDVVAIEATSGCPEPFSYCASDPSTPGGGTNLGVVGSTSVQVDDFTLDVSNAPPSTFGVFFYGQRAGETASGAGLVCVGGPAVRLGVAATTNSGVASLHLDLAQHQTGPAALAPGTHHEFQFWHRASATTGPTWNYSNALSVTFCP